MEGEQRPFKAQCLLSISRLRPPASKGNLKYLGGDVFQSASMMNIIKKRLTKESQKAAPGH